MSKKPIQSITRLAEEYEALAKEAQKAKGMNRVAICRSRAQAYR